MAAGAGVALALALPGPGLVPLVLVVPGLLRRALSGARGWRAFRLGWLAGFAQWIVAVAWVFIVLHRYGHLHAALAVLAVALMAAILGLTWAIAGWATSRVAEGWRIVGAAPRDRCLRGAAALPAVDLPVEPGGGGAHAGAGASRRRCR